jgi:co-chaperonin GroES (HSP10)
MKVVDFNILVEENTSINKLVSGGLVLPNIGTLPMAYGRVVGIGTGRVNKKFNQHVSVNLNVGDLIVYNPGVAKPIKLKNAKSPVFKMKQNEAIMVLEEDGENNVVGVKKVLQNYMLVKRTTDDKVSLGGLVIPEIKRSIDNISGTVFMQGPGTYDPETNTVVPCHCNIGEKVSFAEMSSIQITLPIKGADGKVTKEKFYEVPDSMVDFVFDTDEKGNMKSIIKIKDKHVLVTRDSSEKKTSAGIYVPELDTEGHLVEAEVIFVGDGVEHSKVGDRIVYIDAKENNKEFKIPVKTASGLSSNKKCYMIPETDIEAYLEDDEAL